MNEHKIPAEMLDAATDAICGFSATDGDVSETLAGLALEAAGVPKMLARITELEKQIATIRGTVEAHNVRLESCDRDGQEFCDCLERAMKSDGGE